VVYENRLTDADTLRAIAYLGNRTNVGYLAIPLPQQNGVRNAGGIPDLDRVFGGLGIRWTRQAELAGGPLTFTTGLDYDRADEDRKATATSWACREPSSAMSRTWWTAGAGMCRANGASAIRGA
jgi:iron complex outermembrane receptor protein